MKNTDYKQLWRKSKELIAQQHNTLNSITLVLEALVADKEIGDKAKKIVGDTVIKNKDIMIEEDIRLSKLLEDNG